MESSSLGEIAESICDANHYTLLEKVGEGSYKETFHVHTHEKHSLALKVFKSDNSTRRTDREIAAMRQCDHPNIGKLFSIDHFSFENDSYLYSLEEFFSGGTLTQLIAQRVLSPDEVKSLGEPLISAISHIASHRLVHRDLKPDNIMFRDSEMTPIVVDFGLVRDLSNSSITKTFLPVGPGTPLYAAPEQLNNDKELIDWRTDQFALGVLLTECALQYHPYSRENDRVHEILERVAQREGPAQRFTEAASELGIPILTRMVAPYPIGRIRTAELLEKEWQSQKRVGA